MGQSESWLDTENQTLDTLGGLDSNKYNLCRLGIVLASLKDCDLMKKMVDTDNKECNTVLKEAT